MAVLLEMNIATEQSIKTRLEIETDSKQTIQLLLNLPYEIHHLDSLILNYMSRLFSFTDVRITHVDRYQKSCTNILAK